MRKSAVTVITAASAIALALSGCSSKSSDNGGGSGSDGDVKTDIGVTDDEITLLQLTDHSGVFKVISLAFSAGLELWTNEVNEDGGICDRQIVQSIHDTAYKVDNALPLYEAQKNNALGISNLGGSHILAALKQKLTADKMMTAAGAWASVNLDSDFVLMIGQTYDVEMINGLDFLQEQGTIADGDKIGHIYVDSEFGQNGYLGSQAFAEEHGMTIIGAPIASTDTDMTSTITKMKSEGVKAIAITTPPAALGSAAVQNLDQGLNVPIVGSNPSFAPTLLSDAKVEQALENYYMVSSVTPFNSGNDKADELLEAYGEITQDEPNVAILQGYGWGLTWGAILEEACDAGDLTRDGILNAKHEVTSLDSDGIMGEIDLSKPGAPTSREAFILEADSSKAGGLGLVEGPFMSDEAEAYKAPHEK